MEVHVLIALNLIVIELIIELLNNINIYVGMGSRLKAGACPTEGLAHLLTRLLVSHVLPKLDFAVLLQEPSRACVPFAESYTIPAFRSHTGMREVWMAHEWPRSRITRES